MRRPFAQFTLGRMMIAVAFVGVACWAIVVPPSPIKLVLIMGLGPLVGASWVRLVTVKPFDPATRPARIFYAPNPRSRSQDALLQTIEGGIKGGLLAGVVNTFASVVAITNFEWRRVLQFGLVGVLWLGLFVFVALIAWSIISVLTGMCVGMLVGVLAEAATLVAKGWRQHA